MRCRCLLVALLLLPVIAAAADWNPRAAADYLDARQRNGSPGLPPTRTRNPASPVTAASPTCSRGPPSAASCTSPSPRRMKPASSPVSATVSPNPRLKTSTRPATTPIAFKAPASNRSSPPCSSAPPTRSRACGRSRPPKGASLGSVSTSNRGSSPPRHTSARRSPPWPCATRRAPRPLASATTSLLTSSSSRYITSYGRLVGRGPLQRPPVRPCRALAHTVPRRLLDPQRSRPLETPARRAGRDRSQRLHHGIRRGRPPEGRESTIPVSNAP